MIGIIDPALFLPREEQSIVHELDTVIESCRKNNVRLVGFKEYWTPLWMELGRQLSLTYGPNVRSILHELQKREEPDNGLRLRTAAEAWKRGFTQLFGIPELSPAWENRIASAMLRAAQMDNTVILFTRRMKGRNLTSHSASDVTLDENTRWILHLSLEGLGARQVRCVYHSRNLIHPWTSRFDWRLPAESDGGKYPFVPPEQWWKGSVESIRTVCSKPCWLDKEKNGWARPNIVRGAGEHWDLFIRDKNQQTEIGLSQINVVQYPHKSKTPGNIHHIPTDKAGKLNTC